MYLLEPAVWVILLVALLAACVVSAIVGGIVFIAGGGFQRSNILVIFSLCFLGLAAGFLTGNSRDPAVGAVIPAVLTFLGGLSAYFAITGKNAGTKALLAGCSIALVFKFLMGTLWGANERAAASRIEVIEAKEQSRFLQQVIRLKNEMRLKKLRRALSQD